MAGEAATRIEWRRSPDPVAYRAAMDEMERRVAGIRAGDADECVWLLEHPPVVTAGTSAQAEDLLHPDRFAVHATGRGGRHTYHGPGQRIGYVMLDLDRRGRDVRRFVAALEGWVIAALGALGVTAWSVPGRVGVWVADRRGREAKIGAIGVRVRRWVTLHGFSVNVSPDLGHFDAIVPCGIADHPVTSFADLGLAASMAELDRALEAAFPAFLQSLVVPTICS